MSCEPLALKPETLTCAEAATVPVGATTAWRALFEQGGLTSGQRVLIQGAAGGMGLFAVQLAKWKGAQVIGTASTAALDLASDFSSDVQQARDRMPLTFFQAQYPLPAQSDAIPPHIIPLIENR